MTTKTRKAISRRKPAAPKEQVVRQVRIAVQSGWAIPFESQIVDGTENLLAVTRHFRFDNWEITHLPTGRAFPFEPFASANEAIKVAKKMFRKYPRENLRKNTIGGVIGDLTEHKVRAMAGFN